MAVTKKTSNIVSPAEEIFVQEIIRGNSQRKAAMIAFPKRVNWAPNALDSFACQLFKQQKIKQRYHAILKELQENETKKTEWSREEAIKQLKFVIDKNKTDLERIEAAYEEKLEQLRMMAEVDKDKAFELINIMIMEKKERRVSKSHNDGIINSVVELNKMQGFSGDTVNMTGTVQFIGESELED